MTKIICIISNCFQFIECFGLYTSEASKMKECKNTHCTVEDLSSRNGRDVLVGCMYVVCTHLQQHQNLTYSRHVHLCMHFGRGLSQMEIFVFSLEKGQKNNVLISIPIFLLFPYSIFCFKIILITISLSNYKTREFTTFVFNTWSKQSRLFYLGYNQHKHKSLVKTG